MTSVRADVEAGRTTVRREPGPAEREPVRFNRRRQLIERGLAVGVPAALILLWQAASSRGWIDNRFYPAPTEVVGKIGELVTERDLLHHTWVSIRRILFGYGLGSLAGLSFGLAMGMSRLVRAALEPLLSALYTVPKLALLPIFLTLLGFGEAPIVALIAVTVFFFVWISTMAAIIAVPDGYQEAARSFRVTRWQLFRHVLLPASIPQVFVGLRIAAGVSVLMLVGVEFVLGGEGLGHLIEQGRLLLLLEQTYVGIVLTALIGLAATFIVRWIGIRLSPWAKHDDTTVL